MSQSARVNDNGIDVFGTGLMNTIDQVTFVIALKAGKLSPGHFHLSSGGRNDIIQSRFSINVRFACAKQILISELVLSQNLSYETVEERINRALA